MDYCTDTLLTIATTARAHMPGAAGHGLTRDGRAQLFVSPVLRALGWDVRTIASPRVPAPGCALHLALTSGFRSATCTVTAPTDQPCTAHASGPPWLETDGLQWEIRYHPPGTRCTTTLLTTSLTDLADPARRSQALTSFALLAPAGVSRWADLPTSTPQSGPLVTWSEVRAQQRGTAPRSRPARQTSPLVRLLRAGALHAGEPVWLVHQGHAQMTRLRSDGRLRVPHHARALALAPAARALLGARWDGTHAWHVERAGVRVLLSEIRTS